MVIKDFGCGTKLHSLVPARVAVGEARPCPPTDRVDFVQCLRRGSVAMTDTGES